METTTASGARPRTDEIDPTFRPDVVAERVEERHDESREFFRS
jgi:hypothetical protein